MAEGYKVHEGQWDSNGVLRILIKCLAISNEHCILYSKILQLQLQSTTSITDFFVVGKMFGILVGFIILVKHFNDLFQGRA